MTQARSPENRMSIFIGVLLPRTGSVLPSPTPCLLIKSPPVEATFMKLCLHAKSGGNVLTGEVPYEVSTHKVMGDKQPVLSGARGCTDLGSRQG